MKRINQEAEDLVKEEAKKKSDYFLRMQTLLHESKATKEQKMADVEKEKLYDIELTK